MNRNQQLKIGFIAVIIIILAFVPFSLFSQLGNGTQRLKGTIVDEKGNPVAGARITAKFLGIFRLEVTTRKVEFIPAERELEKEAVSGQNGEWRIIGINFGQWRLTAVCGDLEPAFDIVVLDQSMELRPLKLVLRKKSTLIPTPAAPAPKASQPHAADDAVTSDGVEYQAKIKDPNKLMEVGEELMESDELDKAAVCFLLALKQKPGWSLPYLKLGYAYFNMGQMEKAVEYFRKYLEMEPRSPEAPTVQAIVDSLKEM